MRKLFPTLFLSSVLLVGCSDSSTQTPKTAALPALESTFISVANVDTEMLFDGVIEAVNQATVAAQTSGRVVELPVDVGDFVEKGTLILRLTDTEQRARVESAEAALAAAQAQLVDATANYQRHQELFDKKLVAKAAFDQAESAFKSAEARVKSAEAAVSEAREGLAHTRIHAPYSGIVVSRATQVGQTVAPGTPLITGLSLAHLRVQVDVPQQHIHALRQQGTARVQLGEQVWVESRDLRIPPSAQNHSFRVLVNLPEADYPLLPGSLVKVAFATGSEERLLIPAAAVAWRGEVSGAYVIKDQRLEFRQLRLGRLTREGQYPVLAGAQAGERVALDPVVAASAYQTLYGREE